MTPIERLKRSYEKNQLIKELLNNNYEPSVIMKDLFPNEELTAYEKRRLYTKICKLKDDVSYAKVQQDIEDTIHLVEESIRLYKEGVTIKDIAKKLSKDRERISTYLHRSGIDLNEGGAQLKRDKRSALLRSYYEQGKMLDEVADLLNVEPKVIKGYTQYLDFSFPTIKGEKSNRIKSEIMRLHKQGNLRQSDIAQQLGVTQVYVSRVLSSNGLGTIKRVRIPKAGVEAKKPQILALYQSGVTNQYDIASQLKVSQSFVSRVLREKGYTKYR